MTESASSATVSAQPFPSMDALRRAHKQLFEILPPKDRTPSPADREKSAANIEKFIARAIATGAVLDTVADRREAQGSIDYWVASAYTKPRFRGTMAAAAPAEKDPVQEIDDRPDNQLEAFDPTVIDDAAREGNDFINKLPEKQKDLARQILLRLVHIPHTGDNFSSAPANLDELHKFGDRKQVDDLLEGLKQAGVVDVRSGAEAASENDLVALRYLALTRRWKWFAEEIEQRLNLRNLALSWVGSGRSSGALLDRSLTRRFREYSNLTEWETEFINSSGRRTTKIRWIAAAVLIPVVTWMIVVMFVFYNVYPNPARFERVNHEIRAETTSAAKKIDDIKWLAQFRLPINATGVKLNGEGLGDDLDGIFAPGAIFSNSVLKAVKFRDAFLEGASFNGSVLVGTGFAQATLSRAWFDRAEFCEGVDFTAADLQNAYFRRAKFEYMPVFAQTPWWLINGLNFNEIDLIARDYPRVSDLAKYPKFKDRLDRVDRRIAQLKDPQPRAAALNEKAWALAILGVVSDEVAEGAAKEALGLLDELKQEGQVAEDRAQTGDTMAYILLQKSEKDPATQQQNMQKAVDLLATAAKLDYGEVLFRYAIALNALDRDWTGALESALIRKQYEPTHELYLLNKYFTGNFRQRVIDLTGRVTVAREASEKSNCPPSKKAVTPSTTGAATGDGGDRHHR
jgi:uncharacterized protein YjbI with pentapeptide repeats